jgi:hypothetical protein
VAGFADGGYCQQRLDCAVAIKERPTCFNLKEVWVAAVIRAKIRVLLADLAADLNALVQQILS